ncbi:DCN1-like protein 5 [Abrus precatorius]|uniref:Defective in cullin neddylation protein n=1 Tax=Abrus precatorius TaxID=3816 RepID=A0A8B8K3T7_ABRPR|nr:DCN1-like protein 5 [Abrus precatorius]
MPRRKETPTRSILPSQSRSASKKTASNHVDPIDRLFQSYANMSSGMIEPAGIEALCKDLNVHYADIRILIFAWKMKAETQGFISKDEWRRGLQCLGVDPVTKLGSKIAGLKKEIMAPESFEDFYSYAFQYNLIDDKQRTIDINSACELLNIVLRPAFPILVDLLVDYLKIQKDFRAVNRDQWTSFYHFFKKVNCVYLLSYDSSQGWPVIIDNFVEWLRKKE